MSSFVTGDGFLLRDRDGASRAVAYLMLAASPFLYVTGPLLNSAKLPTFAYLVVTVSAVVIGYGGWVCLRHPQWMPHTFWLAAPFIAVVLITVMNIVTKDHSTGAQLFYLWPVLYAANFLGRRVVHVTVAAVVAGDALVVFTLNDNRSVASADVTAMALAMLMTAVVVVPLRERADQLRRRLEEQALADALTGLANRRSFDAALTEAVDRAHATGEPLAMVTVDLDHFKSINDTYGHAVGDQALQLVADAMRQVTGPGDLAVRLGGDEFVLLLRCGRAPALRTADALRAAVAGTHTLLCGPPGLSIGVAVLPGDATTPDGLAAASDRALYEAKARGRGQVAVAS